MLKTLKNYSSAGTKAAAASAIAAIAATVAMAMMLPPRPGCPDLPAGYEELAERVANGDPVSLQEWKDYTRLVGVVACRNDGRIELRRGEDVKDAIVRITK